MYCPKCGTQNPADARFCGSCAAPMPVAEAAASTAAAAASVPFTTDLSPAGQQAVSTGLNIGIIASSLILPIIGIVMGVIYRLDANSAKRSAGTVWLVVGIGAGVFWLLVASSDPLYF